MPGYRGFIPRISPTELSLGQRYHTGTGKCLKAFAKEQARHDAYYKGTLTDTSSVTVERSVMILIMISERKSAGGMLF